MPSHKHAIIRYNTLDKCFSNFQRKFYFDDLLKEVNEALWEETPESGGIKIRQLRDDIRFMRSEAGFNAPIIAYPDGRKAYYRYEDSGFSIKNSPLHEDEAEILSRAINLLNRFEGAPAFEWLGEVSSVLKDSFNLSDNTQKVISYETNIDYTGYEFISPVFNAIVQQRVLLISYQGFGKEKNLFRFHPYFLKQYNNRWFVFGLHEEFGADTWNIPLDRILEMDEIDRPYIASNRDWEEYLFDIIGVTKKDGEPVEIELIFSSEQGPYIETKPLHASQKSKRLEDGRLQVRLKLIPNFELEARLLSFGEKATVIKPESLKETIKLRLQQAAKLY